MSAVSQKNVFFFCFSFDVAIDRIDFSIKRALLSFNQINLFARFFNYDYAIFMPTFFILSRKRDRIYYLRYGILQMTSFVVMSKVIIYKITSDDLAYLIIFNLLPFIGSRRCCRLGHRILWTRFRHRRGARCRRICPATPWRRRWRCFPLKNFLFFR